MRRWAVAVALLAAAWPAAAASWLEGHFATADGSIRLAWQPAGEGAFTVALEAAGSAPLTLRLEPTGAEDRFQTPAAAPSWMARLMGRDAERLPFAGAQLAIARLDEATAVIDTLTVDERGRPTFAQLRLASADGGLLMERRRYEVTGLLVREPVRLERMAP